MQLFNSCPTRVSFFLDNIEQSIQKNLKLKESFYNFDFNKETPLRNSCENNGHTFNWSKLRSPQESDPLQNSFESNHQESLIKTPIKMRDVDMDISFEENPNKLKEDLETMAS